jgi:hypothetical protein
MGSFFSSLWDGLNDVWDFFSAIWKGFSDKSPPDGNAKFDWIITILASLLGPIGHTYLRIKYYNGSLDHMWLYIPGSFITLGTIPFVGSKIPMGSFIPCSFFASVLLRGGYLKNAQGASVYDWWMLLPIIIKFVIIGLILLTGMDANMIITILSLLLQMVIVAIPLIIRTVDNCKLKSWRNLSSSQWKKIVTDTIVTVGCAHIFSSSFNFIKKPLNKVISPKITNSITWSLGYMTIYMLLNMYNQTDLNKYCTNPNDYNTLGFNNILDTNNITIYNMFVIVSLCTIIYNLYKAYKYIGIMNKQGSVENYDDDMSDGDTVNDDMSDSDK